jgi:glycosyl hydrolase family 99
MRLRIFAAAVLAVVTAGCLNIGPPPPPTTTTTTSSTIPSVQPTFPIHAAFYYPWFPEAWNQQGFDPFTNYNPTLGFYNSSSASTIATHIAQMRYAGMDAGIASWWGQGSDTDNRIPLLLQGAAGTPFRWSLYYEPEGQSSPTVAQLNSDLTYILQHYGNDPSYLRIGGRPVIFVYAQPADACGMATRWVQANARRFYVVLKVFTGYKTCVNQPDAWHQYGPAVATSDISGQSFSVSPGFWKKGTATPRLVRDPARFASDVQTMVASNEKFQLVTTFNEWGEGSSVEPATEWASASGNGTYLDILHQYLAH